MPYYLPLILLAILFNLPSAVFANIGTVTEMKGQATLLRSGEETPLSKGYVIEQGDHIQTTKRGRMVITFKDGSKLTIGSHSHMTIDRFVYDARAEKEKSLFETSIGFFRYISGPIKKEASVKTPVSTIGIRGTDFFWEVKKTGETVVGLAECCVDLSSKTGTVAMEKANTFSKVVSADSKPTKPVRCQIPWLRKMKKGLRAPNSFFDPEADDYW